MGVPGWQQQQQWRVPAFGEWNSGQYDSGAADGFTPLTPCFDAVALRVTDALPAFRPSERPRVRGNSRRRRIPAFGEWNYNGDSYGNGSWPAAATPFLDLAAGQKPRETESKHGTGGVAQAMRRSAEAHGRRGSKVADPGTYAARKSSFTAVAKAVDDDDLYRVPPKILYQKPARRRGWLKILLMAGGCFCPGGTCMAP